uniref:Uncharacterized protein n=1 Tax=Trypanosoma congolense (strain IL3000) TaxID=1068625 RepID=G0UJD7_TRYCI|nr:conserved hypothetical protein [Trypanosoma congolense IL3000]
MRSAAFHFLNTPSQTTSVGTLDVNPHLQSADRLRGEPHIGGGYGSDKVSRNGDKNGCFGRASVSTSSHRKYLSQRPVFISQLLRATRVGVATLMVDGFPCETVCFAARVVRCGVVAATKGEASKGCTVLLLSDGTGIVPVIQYNTDCAHRVNDLGKASGSYSASFTLGNSFAHALYEGLMAGDSGAAGSRLLPPVASPGNLPFYRGLEVPTVNECDYVFVSGRLAFADTSIDTQQVVREAHEFIFGTEDSPVHQCHDHRKDGATRSSICVRGNVRIINDMNEINFWMLSALETHARLLAKKVDAATIF